MVALFLIPPHFHSDFPFYKKKKKIKSCNSIVTQFKLMQNNQHHVSPAGGCVPVSFTVALQCENCSGFFWRG